MRPAATRLLALLLALVATVAAVGLTVAVGPAAAQPTTPPDTSVDGTFLRISVDEVTPTTVTTTSPPEVTVRGTVTNVGDRPVSDIGVRLQRAPAVRTDAGLRSALADDQDVFDTVGNFDELADGEPLAQGQDLPFALSLPLRAADGTLSLGIDRPGIYPMLVNVNGTPDYGQQARLDDATFLLPVAGLPRDTTVPDLAAPTGVPLPPDIGRPVAATVLWPLADRPRLAAGLPGTVDEKVRLIDDDLATSLDTGGRLDGLLTALEFAIQPSVDPDGALAASTCVAVDPDLLVTVAAMTRGYLVVDAADPTGPARDGTGTDAATTWLDRLRALVADRCVVAVPFAQADLSAVAATGDAALAQAAVASPPDVVDSLLGVSSRRDVVWPAAGTVDTAAADMVAATPASAPGATDSGRSLLLARSAVDVVDAGTSPDTVLLAGTAASDRAVLFGDEVSSALAGVGADPVTPAFTPDAQRIDLTADSRTARLQDALGALQYEALLPSGAPGTTPRLDRGPRSLVVVPPQTWTPDREEASAVLGTVAGLLRSGLATPRPLADLLGVTPPAEPATLVSPSDGVPDASLVDTAREQGGRITALQSALVQDPRSALTPALFAAPLREDLLRALGTAGRGGTDPAAVEDAARVRAAAVVAGIDRAYGAVTILAPGGVFTLASEASPLLLVARNDLPIGIAVNLTVDAPQAMDVEDIGPQQLPPRGSRSLQVPARVSDSRKMVVEFSLSTSDGVELGQPAEVTVRSNAYGRALALITVGAGILLVLLVGRRLWHRFRGQPDPADEQ